MIIATPTTATGEAAGGWGRAHWIGIAELQDGEISAWQLHEVGWDISHDAGTHGSHHARIVRFLKEHGVQRVVFAHAGQPMLHTMTKMGLELVQVGSMEARQAVIQAALLQAD